MDFKYIVEHNKEYGENNLRPEDKDFIRGMRWVVCSVLENFMENHFDDETENTLDKIKQEVADEVIEEVVNDIEREVYKVIVEMINSYEDEETKSKNK